MTASFRIVPLAYEPFAPLFGRTDEELRALGARRLVARERPGYPCRVSLEDACPGKTVLLVPHSHHDVPSPYRATGPIFVRRGADLDAAIHRQFESPRAGYLHVHNARPGCFNCRVDRA